MKCPVCGNELNDDCVRCTECTFDQLHKTFLNKEEYEMWMRETVLPCRRVFYKCSKEFIQVGEQYKNIMMRQINIKNCSIEY